MFSLTSLRTRYALIFAILIIALSWIFGVLVSEATLGQLRENIGSRLMHAAQLMAERLNRDIAGRARSLDLLSQLETGLPAERRPDLHQALTLFQQQYPEVDWVGLLDPQGWVMASGDGFLEGTRLQQYAGTEQGLPGSATLLVQPSSPTGHLVEISRPVHDAQGQMQARLVCWLSRQWAEQIRQFMEQSAQASQQEQLQFILLGPDQRVWLGPPSLMGWLPGFAPQFHARDYWQVERWQGGQEYLTGVAKSSAPAGPGWTIIARQPLEQAYQPVIRLQEALHHWGLILSALFAAIAWILTGFITRPLHQMAIAAQWLAAGEKAEIPLPRGSSIEVRKLGLAIQQLASSRNSQRHALSAMKDIAYRDNLTSLANRAALEHYQHALETGKRRHAGWLFVLWMDLDNFKGINDTFGHVVGDQVLQETARRLALCFREEDLLVRVGGDEFLALLPVPLGTPQEVISTVTQRVIAALESPLALGDGALQISCSIGVACWPRDAADLDEVFHLADQALYTAKRAGKNQVHFHRLLTLPDRYAARDTD